MPSDADGGQRHCIRIVNFRAPRIGQPGRKQCEGIGRRQRRKGHCANAFLDLTTPIVACAGAAAKLEAGSGRELAESCAPCRSGPACARTRFRSGSVSSRPAWIRLAHSEPTFSRRGPACPKMPRPPCHPKGTLMAGKRGVVMGVANDRSIAWGIAAACAAQGAEIAFTYQGEALEKRVRPLAESVGSHPRAALRRRRRGEHRRGFRCGGEAPGARSTSWSMPSAGPTRPICAAAISTRRAQAFLQALDISCYSFVAVSQRAERMMNDGGSLLTLTYLGAERVMPHYNVMGVAKAALEASVRYLAADLGERNIRVNAISAGPIKTLAASGIGDFRYILKWNELNAPLGRNVTTEEVGGSGLYLLSQSRRRGDRRSPSCRLRLPYRRHEEPGRARYRHRHRTGEREAAERRRVSHNTFGHLFRVTTWGESHGPAIGCVIDGCPPRIPLSEADIQPYLDRRRPGQSRFTTQRQEPDRGSHPLRRLRGADDRHADRTGNRQCRSAVEGLQQHRPQLPAGPRRPHLPAEIRHPRLSRRRAVLGAGDRDARRGGRRRAQGFGQWRRHPRRHGARWETMRSTRARWDWAAVETNAFFCPDPLTADAWETNLTADPQARLLDRRGDRGHCRGGAARGWARRSTASSTPILPPR